MLRGAISDYPPRLPFGVEKLNQASPWYPVVSVDSERLGGEPVFRGTRVPVRSLFSYLEDGYSLAEFLNDFEGVTKAQAIAVLELAEMQTFEGIRAA